MYLSVSLFLAPFLSVPVSLHLSFSVSEPCLCLFLSHTCITSKELYEACKVNWGHYSSCFMLMNWSALECLECDIISQLSWNCQSENTCVCFIHFYIYLAFQNRLWKYAFFWKLYVRYLSKVWKRICFVYIFFTFWNNCKLVNYGVGQLEIMFVTKSILIN